MITIKKPKLYHSSVNVSEVELGMLRRMKEQFNLPIARLVREAIMNISIFESLPEEYQYRSIILPILITGKEKVIIEVIHETKGYSKARIVRFAIRELYKKRNSVKIKK